MSRFSIKNIMLGIGIGIVLMSIISIIYLAGMEPGKNLSDEDIAIIAAKYDLVKRSEVIDKAPSILTQDTTNTTNTNAATGTSASSAETTSVLPVETSAATQAAIVETTASLNQNTQAIVFTIKSGETSEKIAANLHKDGLIDNEEEFIELIGKQGLEDKIKAGEFQISSKADMNEIVRIITR